MSANRLRRAFSGLGGETTTSLLAQDQTLKAQIAAALAGNPVAGNPFPNATPEQLALAVAGSTAWKPWNQSGTIERAIANTVARFSSQGGSDAILRSLQIASGTQVTVGKNTPGVKVVADPTTTASMKLGIAALLAAQPTPPVSGATGPSAPAPVARPDASGNYVAAGAPAPRPDASGVMPSPGAPAIGLNPVSGILNQGGDVTGGLDTSVLAAAGNALAASGVQQPGASSGGGGIMDLLSAPINLPLYGPAPTWAVGLGIAAAVAAWRSRRRRDRGR